MNNIMDKQCNPHTNPNMRYILQNTGYDTSIQFSSKFLIELLIKFPPTTIFGIKLFPEVDYNQNENDKSEELFSNYITITCQYNDIPSYIKCTKTNKIYNSSEIFDRSDNPLSLTQRWFLN